jgi:hypothetical protein
MQLQRAHTTIGEAYQIKLGDERLRLHEHKGFYAIDWTTKLLPSQLLSVMGAVLNKREIREPAPNVRFRGNKSPHFPTFAHLNQLEQERLGEITSVILPVIYGDLPYEYGWRQIRPHSSHYWLGHLSMSRKLPVEDTQSVITLTATPRIAASATEASSLLMNTL